MASLNTLRTKGGVIISVVIGLALLAFILGDVFSSGPGIFSSGKMKVGEINGKSVDYFEYLDEIESFRVISAAMTGRDPRSSEEQDALRNMAWDAMIMKYAYEPGFVKLGLAPSETEQIDMVNGEYLSPVVTETFRDPETGFYNPAVLKNFLNQVDADPTGQGRIVWEYMKQQMNDQRVMGKFINLVSKGMFVTDLEVQYGVKAENVAFDATVVKAGYELIADSLVNVSSADLKKYYNDNKKLFKQEAVREVEYVLFDLLPSEADYADAEEYIYEIRDEFIEAENPMQYAALNSQISPDPRYFTEDQIEGAIAAAIFGKPDAIYGPVIAGDIYTIARQGDYKIESDSIGAKHILLDEGQENLADSLINVLRRGGDFASTAQVYSVDRSANMSGGDLGRFTPEQMVPEFSEAVLNSRVGDIFKVRTQFGTHIVQTTYKSTPVRKAQIATIKYKVDPGTATQQVVYAEVSKFMAEASGSYDNFQRAASDAGKAKRFVRVSKDDRNVNGIDDSRELVRWAYDSKKGAVSDIMELGGDYVIAALTGVREEGTAKFEEVSSDIRTTLVREKKAEMLGEKMKGTDIYAIAENIGGTVSENDNVTFSLNYLDGAGFEPKLIGAICAGQRNAVSKYVQGNTGVYVYMINDIDESEVMSKEDVRVRLDAMSTSYIAERLSQALFEGGVIKDSRIKFF